MALLQTTILINFLPLVFSQVFKDEGIFSSCAIEVFDTIIPSGSTDRLEMILVIPGGKYEVYKMNNAAQLVKSKKFRTDYRTVLYVHGNYDSYDSDFSKALYDQYILRGRYNILALNSSSLLRSIIYPRGARLTKYIGNRLGILLSQFKKTNLNMEILDLIGHSLGAHICGFAGKTYYRNTGTKLQNIIALDPAGPCFREANSSNRLDKEDAKFVQVFHTNGGWLGIYVPVGHLDVYINGGRKQPSESRLLPCNNFCSHGRAVEVWNGAVSYPSGFIGVKCRNLTEVRNNNCYGRNPRTALVGPTAETRTRGIYYLNTASKFPYYLGNVGAYPYRYFDMRRYIYCW